MKQYGARLHPGSGAGPIKNDGSTDHVLYEVKDARRSYKLTWKELKALLQRALRQDKMGVMLVYFSDVDVTVECRIVPGGRALIGHDDVGGAVST